MKISSEFTIAFLKYNGIKPVKKIGYKRDYTLGYMEYEYEDTEELHRIIKMLHNKDLQVNLDMFINCMCEIMDENMVINEPIVDTK